MTHPGCQPEAPTWDRVWESHPEEAPAPIPQILRALEALQPVGKRVCEIGCGTGKESIELAAKGAQVVCVDFSHEALRLMERLSGDRPACSAVCADALCLPFGSESFDIVYHQGLLEHFRDPLPVLREQVRVLKPGGHLVIDVPQRFHAYALRKRWQMLRGRWPYGWETDYTPAGLRRTARRAGLEPLRAYSWGPYGRLVWTLRHLHEFGQTRFGRPIMPRGIGERWERAWTRWEASEAACWTQMSVGMVCRKPGVGGMGEPSL